MSDTPGDPRYVIWPSDTSETSPGPDLRPENLAASRPLVHDEGPGEPSTFRDRVRANPYTGNETIDAGLRSLREDAINSAKDDRPYSWPGFFHALAMALGGIRGGSLDSPQVSPSRYGIEPGPMHIPGREPHEQPFDVGKSDANIGQLLTSFLGPAATKDVAALPEKYQRALDEGEARRGSGHALAGPDFNPHQYVPLPDWLQNATGPHLPGPFSEGLFIKGGKSGPPELNRVTPEDLKGLQLLMLTGYHTGLPGTIRSSLLEQIPNALRRLLPARALEGLPAVSEEAPSQLRTNAAKHP